MLRYLRISIRIWGRRTGITGWNMKNKPIITHTTLPTIEVIENLKAQLRQAKSDNEALQHRMAQGPWKVVKQLEKELKELKELKAVNLVHTESA